MNEERKVADLAFRYGGINGFRKFAEDFGITVLAEHRKLKFPRRKWEEGDKRMWVNGKTYLLNPERPVAIELDKARGLYRHSGTDFTFQFDAKKPDYLNEPFICPSRSLNTLNQVDQ